MAILAAILMTVWYGACLELSLVDTLQGPGQAEADIPSYDTNTQMLTSLRQVSSIDAGGSVSFIYTFSDGSNETVSYDLFVSNDYQVISKKTIVDIRRQGMTATSEYSHAVHALYIGSYKAGEIYGTGNTVSDTVWNTQTYFWGGETGLTALYTDQTNAGLWTARLKFTYTDGSSEQIEYEGSFLENIRYLQRNDILAIELLERDSIDVCRLYVNGYLFTLSKSGTQNFGTTANPGMIYGWANNNSANAKSAVVIGKDYTAWGSLWETFTESIKTARYPKLIENNSAVDRIYMGAVPSNLDMQKPVLIFVPGRGVDAPMWWSYPDDVHTDLRNNMYRYVFHSGYQAYYVTIGAKDGIRENGKRLAGQIKKIARLHPDREIVLICHSKGGVDSTAALFLNGADQYVSKVITLGTPFEGSFLADLAYTLFGEFAPSERYQATEEMRPDFMRSYWTAMRQIHGTDIPLTVPYYCLYGHNRGPINNKMNTYGNTQPDNDGVVTVESARYLIKKGLAQHMGNWDVDHVAIAYGKSKTRNGGWGASWSNNPVWDQIKSRL